MRMSVKAKRLPNYLSWIGIIFVIAAIVGLHALWLFYYATTQYGEIKNGMLDLQQWEETSGEALTLDGEWTFYPDAFIISNPADQAAESVSAIVPGAWDPVLGSSFGYASYQLRIQLDPDDRQTYAIYVPSIQASSRLYINGVLAGGSGQPAEQAESYTAFNIPYTAKAQADENGIIDVVIEAANYTLNRNSGIELSLEFGEESVIVSRNGQAILMEQLVFVIFALHAIYAAHLYVMGIRNKQLLYLSLLLIIILLTLAGNGNKLIYSWLPLTYISDYQLKGVLLSIGGIALLRCCVHSASGRFLTIASRILVAIGFALVFFSLTITEVIPSFRAYPIYIVSSVIISIIGMIRASTLPLQRSPYMLFLLTALFGMVIWEYVQSFFGIRTLFYPLDLIIAMFCMSSLMFQNYLSMTERNKQLAGKLQQEDKLKDQFLANTSHELRNPLHGILNLSQAVLEREKTRLDSQSVRNLELVLSIGRRMNILLGDLLDLSKLKEQGIQLVKRNVNVYQLTEKTIDSLKYLLQGKDVMVVNEVSSQTERVLADENRLTQVMFNLLHNAIKYTDHGMIAVRAEKQGDMLEISVADTGIGIAPNMVDRIFESYHQVGRQGDVIESGFGLGLSISRQLVELHGGTLKVQSTVGSGSTFYFSIPVAEGSLLSETSEAENDIDKAYADQAYVKLPKTAQHAVQVSDKKETRSLSQIAYSEQLRQEEHRIKILAVDDDPVNLHVLCNILNPGNEIDLYCASGALEALEKLADQSWDLVISDVMMPGMSGYALTSLIRETYGLSELPILLLTARSDLLDVETGLLAGANDYIAKPVNAIELYARVRTLVRLKRSHQEAMSLEAAWLQAQIKPHFVVNTLNSIVALSAIDQNKMIELVNEFSEYLRASYNTYNTNKLVSLEQELKLVRTYLFIQQQRFGDRLHIIWDVDEGINLMLPPLVLQSIIENAVTHGVLPLSRGGSVSVSIKVQPDGVQISISDNGIGMSDELIQIILAGQPPGGIGLYNTNLRLKQHYRNGLSISSQPGQGTKVTFTIPI